MEEKHRPEKMLRDFGTVSRWIEEGDPKGYTIECIHTGTRLSTGISYCEIMYCREDDEKPPQQESPSH